MVFTATPASGRTPAAQRTTAVGITEASPLLPPSHPVGNAVPTSMLPSPPPGSGRYGWGDACSGSPESEGSSIHRCTAPSATHPLCCLATETFRCPQHAMKLTLGPASPGNRPTLHQLSPETSARIAATLSLPFSCIDAGLPPSRVPRLHRKLNSRHRTVVRTGTVACGSAAHTSDSDSYSYSHSYSYSMACLPEQSATAAPSCNVSSAGLSAPDAGPAPSSAMSRGPA